MVEQSALSGLQQAEEVARAGGPVLQKLERIAAVTLERFTSKSPDRHSPQLSLEIWAEASKNPEVKALCSRSYEQWQKFLVDLLREGIATGEFKAWVDPEAFAAILVAVFDGLSLQEGITHVIMDWQRITLTLRRGLSEGIVA